MATNSASKFFFCILFTQFAMKQYHVILDIVALYVSYLIIFNVGSVIPQVDVAAAAIVMVNSSALHLMYFERTHLVMYFLIKINNWRINKIKNY
ncbi:hypothetical protein HN51_035156 [Arachis hypogaea]